MRRRLTSSLSLLLLLILTLAAVYETVLFIGNRHQATTSSDVACTATAADTIITVFYVPGATAAQQSSVLEQLHGVLRERYPALRGISVTVPPSQATADLQLLRHSAYVTSASASADQGCQDPD